MAGRAPVHPFSKFGVRPNKLIKQGSDPIENGAQVPDPEFSSIPDRLLGV
jgi:hypothetical protein